jgi:hypothetical protein
MLNLLLTVTAGSAHFPACKQLLTARAGSAVLYYCIYTHSRGRGTMLTFYFKLPARHCIILFGLGSAVLYIIMCGLRNAALYNTVRFGKRGAV